MKRTVLITRPEEDALPLAETLRARDLRVLIEPMLRIKPIRDLKVDLEGVQALLFSSSNGVRAFAALNKNRELPVFTTGEASARVARNLGFKTVEGADGDVSGLVRLVRQRLKPGDGALFHGAGSVVAGDLASQLSSLGYNLRREVVYEAVQADALSSQLLQKLEAGEIDMVLLFSPRTVETFLTLLKSSSEGRPALAASLGKSTALCISRAVADAARAAGWRNVEVAERPDLNAMLSLVERTTVAPDSQAPGAGADSIAGVAPGASAPSSKPLSALDLEAPSKGGKAQAAPRRSGRWVWISAAAVALFVILAGLATVPAWRSLFGERSDEGVVLSTPAVEEETSAAPAAEQPAASTETAAVESTAETADTASATSESTTAEAPAAEEPAAEAESSGTAADTAGANAGGATADAATATTGFDSGAAGSNESTAADAGETALTDQEDAGAADEATHGAAATAADPRVDDLLARLSAIEAAVVAGGSAAGTDAGTTSEALAAIEQRLAALEQGGTPSANADELATLSERVTAIEQLLIDFMTEVPAESLADVKTEVQRLIDENEGLRNQLATLTERFEQADSTAFMLAVGRLGAALNEGRPYEAELATLQKLAAADPALAVATPALETLAAHAAEGAPGEIALAARFPDVARAIVQAAQQEGIGAETEQAGWFDRLIGRLSELVTVRPVGEDVEGDGPAARVARAEARLAVGDLAGAVDELDQLAGAPAAAAADWLAAAKARLAVLPAFQSLDALALERLGTGAGTGG
jgi:uroporphyrinogen-III synthase